MPTKNLLITIESDSDIKLDISGGDLVPGVRVKQFLFIKEDGLLGESPNLDLDDNDYFPVQVKDEPFEDGQEGHLHILNSIEELGLFLDNRFKEKVPEQDEDTGGPKNSPPSKFRWDSFGNQFIRELDALSIIVRPNIVFKVSSALSGETKIHDFLQIIDQDGQPVEISLKPDHISRLPKIQTEDGKVWTGFYEISQGLTERYIKDKSSNWVFGSNHYFEGGAQLVWTRMVKPIDRRDTPEQLTVKVLKTIHDDPLPQKRKQVIRFVNVDTGKVVNFETGKFAQTLPIMETVDGQRRWNGLFEPIQWLTDTYRDFGTTHWNFNGVDNTFTREAHIDKSEQTVDILVRVFWEDPD